MVIGSSGGSVMSIGLRGMQDSANSIQRSANDITQLGTLQASQEGADTGGSMIDPLMNMKIEQHVFDASAKVVKVGGDMIGSLLDITA